MYLMKLFSEQQALRNLTKFMQNKEYNSTIDYDQYNIVEDSIESVIFKRLFTVLFTFGITGICITIFVLSRKHMITSTNCHLVAMSISDLCFLIMLQVLEWLKPDYSQYTEREHYIYMMFAGVIEVFLVISIWLTVVLAMERYIAICRPFLAAKLCTVRNSLFVIATIYVLAVVIRLPRFLESKLIKIQVNNETHDSISPFVPMNLVFRRVYDIVVNILITSVIPFVLLFVLNIRLILEIRKSSRYVQKNMFIEKRNQTRRTLEREEFQVTAMLISIVAVFFVCQAPYVLLISFFVHHVGTTVETLQHITMLLLTLKSAVNFIIYCWFSEKFWMTLKSLACCKFALKQMNNWFPKNRRESTTAVGGTSYMDAATSRDTIAGSYVHLAANNRADTIL